MNDDVFTPGQKARYEGLLTAVLLAYIKDRDRATIETDIVDFQRALEELTDFLVTLGAETVLPGVSA